VTDTDEFVAWVVAYGQRVLGRQVTCDEAIRTGEQLQRYVLATVPFLSGGMPHIPHRQGKLSIVMAVVVAVAVFRARVIEHVVNKNKPFQKGYFFWRFTEHFMQHTRFPPSASESTVRPHHDRRTVKHAHTRTHSHAHAHAPSDVRWGHRRAG